MDTRPDMLDDATLHAYVDGQLASDDHARVVAALAQSPAEAMRALAWQAQREQLRSLQADVLHEPVPPALLAALQPPARRWPQALAAAVLLSVGLITGMAWQAHRDSAQASPGMAFARDAAVAHVLYTPERRHPVEVAAAEQAHLVQWLSKRLGAPLRVPVLSAQGYALVGGRLLPGSADDGAPAGARAQFMYEDAGGRRLTLYVSVFDAGSAVPTAFRLAGPLPGSAVRSFYWLDGRQGYALSGELPADALAALARTVYEQLAPQSVPMQPGS